MATLEQQVEITERAFEELAGKGQEWVGLDDVARRAIKSHRQQRRERRSRLANSLADCFLSGGISSSGRIPFRYRHQTQIAAGVLEGEGKVEHRFLDSEGVLRKDPPGRRDFRDRRYRLVPEAAQGAEISPRDRFEGIARRIEALPGAITDGEGQEAVTAVSTQIKGPQNKSWPRPTTLDLRVAYFPSRDEDSQGDPQSIVASWSTPTVAGGTAAREEYLSAGQVDGGGMETGRVLDVLENSVRAVELTDTAAGAQAEVGRLFRETFLLPEPALGAAGPSTDVRRHPGPPQAM